MAPKGYSWLILDPVKGHHKIHQAIGSCQNSFLNESSVIVNKNKLRTCRKQDIFMVTKFQLMKKKLLFSAVKNNYTVSKPTILASFRSV